MDLLLAISVLFMADVSVNSLADSFTTVLFFVRYHFFLHT